MKKENPNYAVTGNSAFPGPGTYKVRPKTVGPAFSVASKPPLLEPFKIPGPGTYETDKIKNSKKTKASIVFG